VRIIEVCDIRFEPNRQAAWGEPDGVFSTTGYLIRDRGRVMATRQLTWRERVAVLFGARVAVSLAYVP
jgi:hypothetical protein